MKTQTSPDIHLEFKNMISPNKGLEGMEHSEFDKEMMELCPNLYKSMWNKDNPKRKDSIYWGLEIFKGWHDLVRTLSSKLEEQILLLPDEEREKYHAVQVKQKFGSLCFYMSAATKNMKNLIFEAVKQSKITCEECGSPGEVKHFRWSLVLCERHFELFKKKYSN